MASELSSEFNALNLNDNRGGVRLSATANPIRRNLGSNHLRQSQTKRAATIDPETNDEKLRIVILGATKVGKTCLCQQFLQQKFVIDHKETVDEMHSIELNLDDRRLTLEILDTAGIDEFPVMRRIAIAHGDAFLIVYAVDNAQSFEFARQMRQLVLEIKGGMSTNSFSNLPIVIVANKCDIELDRREVNLSNAESIVRGEWAISMVESTCCQRASVLNVFHILLQLVNINLTFNPDGTRRSSDPSLLTPKEQRVSTKRQSCAQQ